MQIVQPLSAARLPTALLTIHTVCAVTGLDRKFIYRAASAGRFPKPIRIGNSQQTRWRSADVLEWIAAQGPQISEMAHEAR